jgi:hypothetical protein
MPTLALGSGKVATEELQKLPTTARPKIDARDVQVPEGYSVEVVMAGLSFPCGLTVAEDGTIFIAEGGTTWPTRPWLPSRLLRLTTNGEVDVVAVEEEGGLRGLCARDGFVYATAKGGYTSRLLKSMPNPANEQCSSTRCPMSVGMSQEDLFSALMDSFTLPRAQWPSKASLNRLA